MKDMINREEALRFLNEKIENKNMPSGLKTMTASIASADNYIKWIIENFMKYIGTSILEVGIGYGNFKPYLLNNSTTYVSLDIDEYVIKSKFSKYNTFIIIVI